MPNITDLSGQSFSSLRVVERVKGVSGPPQWLCYCDPELGGCGGSIVKRRTSLLRGGRISCGCLYPTSGGHASRTTGRQSTEYQTWQCMKRRCESTNALDFPRYGGRGVRVCRRWHDFASFLEDMVTKPSARHSIDRIDGSGSYTCGKCDDCHARDATMNCRWATVEEQSRNRRHVVMIEFQGVRLCMKDWAARVGLSRFTLAARLELGWSIERALTAPKRAWNARSRPVDSQPTTDGPALDASLRALWIEKTP